MKMDTPTMEREAKLARDETMKLAAPFQMFWKATLFDIPMAMASESVRFYGRRLQSHGDYLANLNHCRSVPEMIEAHSHFIRKAVDVFGDEPSKMAEDVRDTVHEAQNQINKTA
jgi:ABC-type uncharacterized transport system involved in gliding motility auxiliary subunit